MIDPKKPLYISDLDGTLLDGDGQLSEDSVKRINRLIDKGLNFTIATARNYDSAYPLLKDLNLKYPVILFNGVYLTELHTGENLFLSNFISLDIISKMISLAEAQKVAPFIYTYGSKHLVYYKEVNNLGAKSYVDIISSDQRAHKVNEFIFSDSDQITGFLLIDVSEVLEPIYTELITLYKDALNIYFAPDVSNPHYFWLQSFHLGANKGKMLMKMTEHLDISLSNTVVFGDYLNDLDMFKVAGYSIAVENALPEVKCMADQLIPSNIDQGVLVYLESLFE